MRFGDNLCRGDSPRDSNGCSCHHDRNGGDDYAAQQVHESS
jgi:hypothetical protein